MERAHADVKAMVKNGEARKRGMEGFSGPLEGLHQPLLARAGRDRRARGDARPHRRRDRHLPRGFTVAPEPAQDPRKPAATTSRTARRVDWGTGEALAFGSLVLEGTPVRLSGQDSRRGTFTQRHAVVIDFKTGSRLLPARATSTRSKPPFDVYDSSLSEAAVMGFEFGYSLDDPESLVMWEAQFGDFANGAQVVIDQFLASGESKWNRSSGLVLLLPHAYEGQGPEHSSARLERFLQMCAEDNIQVVYPTTPAQYLPPPAPAGEAELPQAARGDDAQEPAAPAGRDLAGRASSPAASFREVLDDSTPTPSRHARAALLREGLLRPCQEARGAEARRRSRSCGWSSSTRGRRSNSRRCWAGTAVRASGCGCRRNRRTWAAGRSSSRGCGRWTSRSSTSAATPAPARRPARTTSTNASRN